MTTGNRRFIIPHHRCDARPMGGIVITTGRQSCRVFRLETGSAQGLNWSHLCRIGDTVQMIGNRIKIIGVLKM